MVSSNKEAAQAAITMNASDSTANSRAEGARYALLRRLAPAMRHDLVVNLQPIGLIYDVMDKRLQAPVPDLAKIKDSAAKINGFSRAAVRSCLDVMTWLAPEDGATSTVADGVRECVALLNGNFNFRGFSIDNRIDGGAGFVPRAAIRTVLTAAMLAGTDERPPPADVVLSCVEEAGSAVLTVAFAAASGRQGFPNDGAYRDLVWADVEAIAADEAVAVSRQDDAVRLTFPLVVPTVPLTVD